MKARLFICLFKPKAIYCRCFINQQVSSVMAMYNNIFKITHNDVLPAQGSILISEPFLQDAYFQRSVVLLVEHTQEGSMGFVLNKKTELSVNTFFADLQGFPEMPIYLGGPVSANRLFFIHSLGDLIIPNSLKINDHLYFDGDFSALIHYIQNGHSVDGKVAHSGWMHDLRPMNFDLFHCAVVLSASRNNLRKILLSRR